MQALDRIERAETTSRPLSVVDLGTIGYMECWEKQKELASAVWNGSGEESLLLLEHPHTYTCGRRGGRDHILLSPEQLREAGVEVLDVDRGGDVTYHGPGQLVAYPIFRLSEPGRGDFSRYVRLLEAVLISVLDSYGIAGSRISGYSGAWVETPRGDEKIAAVGVKVDSHGITSHGVALNVTSDLSFFRGIVPCGIADKGVTSLEALLPAPPAMADVKRRFAHHFASTFGFSVTGIEKRGRTDSIASAALR